MVFSETDAAGIVHFSRFFVWMEDAEHALLRSFGQPVHLFDDEGERLFPRVHAEADYLRPLRFDEEAAVEVWIDRRSTRSVTYRFAIRRPEGALAAVGRTVVVFARPTPEGMAATPFPAELARALDDAQAATPDSPPEVDR
ncbi:MAG: acyl-CoA thioesterase [Alphaproteobacteria bacterium]|nr:acyl-CoA thioesterase [Alphaproteobacteria bacterium]